MMICKLFKIISKYFSNFETYTKIESIKSLSVCKQDCDFSALFAANYTNDAQSFIRNVVKTLPPQVGATCGQTLSKYLNTGPVTADSILSSLGNLKI